MSVAVTGSPVTDTAGDDEPFVAVAEELIERVMTTKVDSVSDLLASVARQYRVSTSMVSQVFWELVRLRIVDPHGSLRSPEVSAPSS